MGDPTTDFGYIARRHHIANRDAAVRDGVRASSQSITSTVKGN
jgi:hypothetical protein